MVLANQVVADMLARKFSAHALRMHHPSPRPEDLEKLDSALQKIARQAALPPDQAEAFRLKTPRDFSRVCQVAAGMREGVLEYLEHRWIKCQEPANYVLGADPAQKHFALMLDHYTHFTSPMRRLCDNFIHMQLEAMIDGLPPREVTPQELSSMNSLRKALKRLKRDMDSLFVRLLAKNTNAFVPAHGIIVDFSRAWIRIYIPLLGTLHELYFKDY